jgi:abortive infection bacteriophage resistance protein
MQVLNYIRNICAHHSRLWNRNLTVQLAPKHLTAIRKLVHLRASSPSTTARLFSALCVLDYLMTSIDPAHTWTGAVCELITDRVPACVRSVGEMGFPTEWSTLLFGRIAND